VKLINDIPCAHNRTCTKQTKSDYQRNPTVLAECNVGVLCRKPMEVPYLTRAILQTRSSKLRKFCVEVEPTLKDQAGNKAENYAALHRVCSIFVSDHDRPKNEVGYSTEFDLESSNMDTILWPQWTYQQVLPNTKYQVVIKIFKAMTHGQCFTHYEHHHEPRCNNQLQHRRVIVENPIPLCQINPYRCRDTFSCQRTPAYLYPHLII
jgi:hypothetical protein